MIAGDGDIGCDGTVGIQGVCAHLRALESNLLLDGEDGVDGVGRLHPLQRPYEHRNTNPVVERFSGDAVAGKVCKLAVDGDGGADLDPEALYLFLACSTHIDKHILDLDLLLALLLFQHVRRFRAENAHDRAVFAVQDHPLRVEHRPEPSPDRDDPDEPLLIDILDHQPYLVHVGGKHDREPIAAFYSDQVAHTVLPDLVDRPGNLSPYDIPNAPLAARDAMGVGQLPQQLFYHSSLTSSTPRDARSPW